jgi:hypothetical protein
MDETPQKTIINVQYNIPRFIVAMPGKQNRACTGEMNIIAGVANPFEFQYSNTDGVPINLAGYTLRLVFWFPQNQYETLGANRKNNIILAKDLAIADPYKGTAYTLLTDQDTLALARIGRSTVRWSIYIIDKDAGNVFQTQITSNGDPYGLAHLSQSDIPNAETILGITVAPQRVPPPVWIALTGLGTTAQFGELTVPPAVPPVFSDLVGQESVAAVGEVEVL